MWRFILEKYQQSLLVSVRCTTANVNANHLFSIVITENIIAYLTFLWIFQCGYYYFWKVIKLSCHSFSYRTPWTVILTFQQIQIGLQCWQSRRLYNQREENCLTVWYKSPSPDLVIIEETAPSVQQLRMSLEAGEKQLVWSELKSRAPDILRAGGEVMQVMQVIVTSNLSIDRKSWRYSHLVTGQVSRWNFGFSLL